MLASRPITTTVAYRTISDTTRSTNGPTPIAMRYGSTIGDTNGT